MQKILAFDLSSVCIGVVAAKVEDNKLTKVLSCPIIPPKFNSSALGFLKSKKKVYTSSKETKMVNSYVYPNETYVSEANKKKRDVQVRKAKDIFVLDYIGKQLNTLIDCINPDLIIVEKTEIFNGVLTSVLLAKVFGVLVGAATSKNIEVKEYKVKEVREIIDIVSVTKDLVENLTDEEINRIPDMTKRALRTFMEKKYGHLGLKCSTDDEGDACVVFNYWCHLNNIC